MKTLYWTQDMGYFYVWENWNDGSSQRCYVTDDEARALVARGEARYAR